MDAIQQINQRIETIEAAIRGKKRRIKILKDDLASEQLETSQKDERKMRSIQSEISRLEKDVSEGLPAQIKACKDAIKEAERAAKEAALILPRQEALIPEIEKTSKELLEKLEEAEELNQKLLKLNDGFRAMEKKLIQDLIVVAMESDSCQSKF